MDVPGIAWGINIARDGELAAVAYADGTIRWHRWSDGRLLLTLFIHKEDKRWVAWTPTGYYMASPGGEGLIGWHINRGWEQSADFFPASRFRERFNRPDIVRLVLQTLDEDEAVKRANESARRKQETKPLMSALPPVLRITSPVEGTRFSREEVTLGYELRSPSGTEGRPDRGVHRRPPAAGARRHRRTRRRSQGQAAAAGRRGLADRLVGRSRERAVAHQADLGRAAVHRRAIAQAEALCAGGRRQQAQRARLGAALRRQGCDGLRRVRSRRSAA